MNSSRWTLPLLLSAMLSWSGCAMISGSAEPALEDETERPDRRAANEPASLADLDDELDDAEVRIADAKPAENPVKSVAPPTGPHLSARPRAISDSRTTSPLTDRPSRIAAPERSSASDPDAELVKELVADARREGTLTASDEASFRGELATIPSALRPQMARMMLAVRQRARQTESDRSTSPARRNMSGEVANASSSARADATLAPPTAASLADNPLRSIAALAQSARSGDRSPVASVAAAPKGIAPSNAPAELGSDTAPAHDRRPVADSSDVPTGKPSLSVDRDAVPAFAAVNASANEPLEEWHVILAAAIRSLEDQLARRPAEAAADPRQARLRMLYLLANRRDDALRPLAGADASEQRFWNDWLFGTSEYLDAKKTPHLGQRSALAADRLRDAVGHLGENANLEIANLAFCRRVTSFGVYEPLVSRSGQLKPSRRDGPPYVFTPNQEVLLYAEVRNFTSRETPQGFHTVLRPSYQIFDAQGRRVGSVAELDESHDYCQRRRTDFFVCYHIYLPTRIDEGDYKLKLTIEDVEGKKVQESGVEFAIKGR